MSKISKIYRIFGIPLLTRERRTEPKEVLKSCSKEKPQLSKPLRIAITNGGGMGDSIIDVAFIQNLRKHLPQDAEIDYYAKSYPLFRNMPFLNKVEGYNKAFNPKSYDLVMTNHRFFIIGNFVEEKIKQQAPVLYKYVKYQQELRSNILKGNNDNNNLYSQYAELLGKNRWEQLDLQGITGFDRYYELYMPLQTEYMSLLKRYNLNPQGYITINRGVDSNLSELCPKLWPLEYYKILVELLREKYPNIKLVQIGANDKYGVIGADINLLGKTNIEETKILLKNSLLHIDVEGGLVHLNHTLHGKSCVIFGPTKLDEFLYENNINVRTNICNPCCWVTQNWQKGCLRGYNIPPCMAGTKPEDVMERISTYLDNKEENRFKVKVFNHNSLINKELYCVGEFSQKQMSVLSKSNKLIIYKDKITDEDIENVEKYNCVYTWGNQYNLPCKSGEITNILWMPQQGSLYQEYVFNELMRTLSSGGKLYVWAEDLSPKIKNKISIAISQTAKFIEIIKE